MSEILRVLIAEDCESDALLVVHELKRSGYSVVFRRVETEDEFRAAAGEPWDAVISDYYMPRLSGLDVIRILREREMETPAIIISGVKGEDFAVTAMRAGARDYILKSNLQRLAPAIERELRNFERRNDHRRDQNQIKLLNRILRTISEINKIIVRQTGRDTLLGEVCRILTEHGGFRMAWIGEADFATGEVSELARAGCGVLFKKGLEVRCDDSTNGRGPTGRALKTGRHVICASTEADETFALWRDASIELGFKSSAAFPIFVRGAVFGSINVYAQEPNAFGDEVVSLLDEMAGNIGYAMEAMDAVAERKRAVAALRDSEQTLRTIFESAMDGMFVIDMKGRYMDVNLAGCQMFGYTRDELLASDVRLLLFPEDIQSRLARMENFIKTGTFIPDARMRRKDGSEIWVEMAVTPFRIHERELVLGVKRDITERKMTERELRESEERFREIFEQNENAQLIFKCGTCSIIDANPAAVALYGFTREELIEKGPVLFTGTRDFQWFERVMEGVLEGKSLKIDRMGNVRKDGNVITVSARGQIISLKQGKVVYCTFRDMTEKMRMEEEARFMQAKLIHANKMTSIGTLASGVAHEINNPNNFILFNSSLLADAWQDAVKILAEYYRENGEFTLGGLPFSEMCEVIPELLSGINDGSRRIKGIVDSLKDFSRVDKSGMDGEIDINTAVMASASILSNQICRHTDNFSVACAENLPPVKGSAQKIEQVIINLIMNALHALPDKKRAISVSTSCDGANVIVKVRDEGIGMTKELIGRITEPFFTTKSDAGGTGLGLSISYSIIKEHKGSLEFDSAPGKGTTVTIRLPACRCQADARAENLKEGRA